MNERSRGNTSFSSGNVISQGANRNQNREELDGGGTVDRSHLSDLGFAGSVSVLWVRQAEGWGSLQGRIRPAHPAPEGKSSAREQHWHLPGHL